MTVPICSMNSTGDIYLLNQNLINAANTAIYLNTQLNSIYYTTLNMTELNNFQSNHLPLLEHYINIHGTTHMSYCSRVTSFKSNFYLRNILQTYVQPFVIFFTIITNCLISIVLNYPTMRNSTNIILLGIAICDLLTVLLPLPVYLCFLTSNIFSENLTIFKGYSVTYLTTILPTVCHTSSIWLTVLLALQRFIYVQFPLKANQICLCQWRSVQLLIILTVLAGLLLQLPHMIVMHFINALEYCFLSSTSSSSPPPPPPPPQQQQPPSSSSPPPPLSSSPSSLSISNYLLDSQFISYLFNTTDKINHYHYIRFQKINLMKCTPMSQTIFFTLLLIRVLIVNLIPCIMLTILTGLLIMALRRFIQNRQKLLKINNNTTTNNNNNDKKSITFYKNNINSYIINKKYNEINQLEKSDQSNQNEINLLNNELKSIKNNKNLKKKSLRHNLTDTDSTSKMMLVILGIFLFTEIPTTICLCIYAFITLLDIYPPSAFYQICVFISTSDPPCSSMMLPKYVNIFTSFKFSPSIVIGLVHAVLYRVFFWLNNK
ncbi:unnamed protein product [Schistosoma margrebowiei]|uniref:G_PROTEIN_RECEP_F1_2 domain-containing protein n=1 Tax=Schistosoma margrebowiei TaxID=48269 RepID=A0AA84ZQL7_9TREM|nr:unnamed protein product [Schistosoma margrebowiei]